MAVPNDAPHFDAAMAWINHALKPEISQDMDSQPLRTYRFEAELLGRIAPDLAEQYNNLDGLNIVFGYPTTLPAP